MAGVKDWLVVKNAPVLDGERVIFIDEDELEHGARVESALSCQMRLVTDKGYHVWVFYRDKGVTWKR